MKNIPDELYSRILKIIPIACVDLIVTNSKREILLLKRKNTPAKDEWWFPGGRVHFMETREDAVGRKLREECGLQGKIVKEIGTYDLILDEENNNPSHAITTVFHVEVNNDKVAIDNQSVEYEWRLCNGWLKNIKSPFVRMILQKVKETDAAK